MKHATQNCVTWEQVCIALACIVALSIAAECVHAYVRYAIKAERKRICHALAYDFDVPTKSFLAVCDPT